MASKLIHVAMIYTEKGQKYLYLRQKEPKVFSWFTEDEAGQESETPLTADAISEALRLGARHWKQENFKPLGCGYCFSLPERDEHGMNALFYQMSAALQTFNGVYLEEDYGYYCSVKQIPLAARELWAKLKAAQRL